MYKVIPKEYLPEDLQGTQGRLIDISRNIKITHKLTYVIQYFVEKWGQALEDHHDFFVKNSERVSRKHAKTEVFNSQFGVDGSFIKIELD